MFGFFRKKGKGNSPVPPGLGGGGLSAKRVDASIAEMLKVIRRVLADGVVTEEEAAALSVWTAGHPEVVEAWPGKVLAHRLERIFRDGKVDKEERADLKKLLTSMAGGNWGVRLGSEGPGGIPLTQPPPVLVFPDREFVFAGEFAFGPVAACEDAVGALGGRTAREVGPGTDVLVMGAFGARDWRVSREGAQIREAQRLAGEGREVAIVSEDYWMNSLPDP